MHHALVDLALPLGLGIVVIVVANSFWLGIQLGRYDWLGRRYTPIRQSLLLIGGLSLLGGFGDIDGTTAGIAATAVYALGAALAFWGLVWTAKRGQASSGWRKLAWVLAIPLISVVTAMFCFATAISILG